MVKKRLEYNLVLTNTENKQMGIKAKNDKLDLIASIFEGETSSSFHMCCEDQDFRNLVIDHAMKPTGEIVKILSNYANENLI